MVQRLMGVENRYTQGVLSDSMVETWHGDVDEGMIFFTKGPVTFHAPSDDFKDE